MSSDPAASDAPGVVEETEEGGDAFCVWEEGGGCVAAGVGVGVGEAASGVGVVEASGVDAGAGVASVVGVVGGDGATPVSPPVGSATGVTGVVLYLVLRNHMSAPSASRTIAAAASMRVRGLVDAMSFAGQDMWSPPANQETVALTVARGDSFLLLNERINKCADHAAVVRRRVRARHRQHGRRANVSDAFDERRRGLEEEYFRRQDREALEKMRARLDAETEALGRTASALQCPRCDGTLKEFVYEDVRLDRCEKCRGVWFDAGELEHFTKREGDGGGWVTRLWRSFVDK